MAATVQASCPGCRNILRIPVDWADRALRCKKCGTVVQAKKKGRESAASPAPTPPSIPVTDTATAPAVGQTAPAAPVPAAPEHPYPAAYPAYGPPPQPGVDPSAAPYPYPPQPGYPYPPQPAGYGPYPPPGYGYPPQGYGYPPQGYGHPPHPGAYPPGTAYPYSGPPGPAHPEPLALDDGELPEATSTRRKYNRGSGNGKIIGVLIAVVLLVGLVGGGVALNKYVENSKPRVGNQAAAAHPDKNRPGSAEPAKGPSSPNPVLTGDPFPRRLLFMHVANYIYFNNLSAGSSGGQDMPTKSAAKMAYELRVPANKDNNQLFVLSDTTTDKKDFRPPVKSVLMSAYDQFFQTCREQDRIVVYFGGHAAAAEGKAYLVPVEGEPDNPATFIPLDDFYAKLKDCKAQQKVVLFDVCRLDPARGEEKPGGDKMSEELAKLLLAAPPGVRVALSASPGENAQEDADTGSEFLTAFRVVAEKTRREGKVPPQKPDDPLPAAQWLDGIKGYLARQPGKLGPQTMKIGGSDPTAQVAFNKDEPAAKRFDWPAPPKGVSGDEVVKILQQVNLPGIRADLAVPADLSRVYPFSEEVMKAYLPDGVSDDQVRKDEDKYPVRKAALDALAKINEVWKVGGDGVGIMEEFTGEVDDKLKKDIQNQQVVPAKITLALDEVIAELEAAGKGLDKEKSKRWRAVYQYALAQSLLRWTFIQEYDGALGKIRTDSLPKDPGGMRTGVRLVSSPKTSQKHKEKVEQARELLDKMAEEHKGTPYEVLAKLHKHISVGLEWRSVSKMKKDDDAK